MPRPAVDAVVPFAGPADARMALEGRLSGLRLQEGDSLLIVDNNPRPGPPPAAGGPPVLHAPGRRTPGHARNRGAEGGEAPWILFLDADVLAPPDLLDRYFEPPPGEGTGLLAGGLVDEPVPPGGRSPAAVRWASVRGGMSQDTTFAHGRFAFAQTANCMVRRVAFEAVGGFRDELRAGEDADFCYRLAKAGWRLERREGALAVHRSRRTVRALLAQHVVHGSGAAWLDRRYPGSFPARGLPGMAWWALRSLASAAARAPRRGDRDGQLVRVLDPLTALAFELGRSLPNERPAADGGRRALRRARAPQRG